MKYLGETIDIHGAGLENQFPHNECEIAQSESVTGKPFVKYWMHNNMVTTGGVKMGKSLGNSAYLRDLFKPPFGKGEYNPLVIRFALLLSTYRSTTEFTTDALDAAKNAYDRLINTFDKLVSKSGLIKARPLTENEKKYPGVMLFLEAMDNDFNTAQAVAALNSIAKVTNSMTDAPDSEERKESLERQYQIWRNLAGEILGILPAAHNSLVVQAPPMGFSFNAVNPSDPTFSAIMQLAIRWRKAARDRRDFAMSDTIRKELEEAGVILEDSKEGTTWRLK